MWIVCQLGAREHYAIPRALHHQKKLAAFITDAWVTPQSPLHVLPVAQLDRLRQRYHTDLARASIGAFTSSLLHFELTWHLRNISGWDLISRRNEWFQQQVMKELRKNTFKGNDQPFMLFSYSYTALKPFEFAKNQGWSTVLGQIDPGPVDEELVAKEHRRYPNYKSHWQPAPPYYWDQWRKECMLADHIVVNSQWSSEALQQTGIPPEKIQIIPLAYQPPNASQAFIRRYPKEFSKQRPLRILFLGRVALRKGIAALLDAAQQLTNEPIEFWIVGPCSIQLPKEIQHLEQIHWFGGVSRAETTRFYQEADVFLFPTLSDGFGITQLEAQAWKLPLIVSPFCGAVVHHQYNGIVLEQVDGETIVETLRYLISDSCILEQFSKNSVAMDEFSLARLQKNLSKISCSPQ